MTNAMLRFLRRLWAVLESPENLHPLKALDIELKAIHVQARHEDEKNRALIALDVRQYRKQGAEERWWASVLVEAELNRQRQGREICLSR